MIKLMADKEHQFLFRVYFEDTDQMGIIYHANYLDFFERARTELLRDYGLSLTDMAKCGTNFSIYEANIRYFYPGRLDDMLCIKTTCERKKSCSLLFHQRMFNQNQQLLSQATVQVVCVNNDFKPKRLPNHLQG